MPFKTACSAFFLFILALEIYKTNSGYELIIPLIACFMGDIFMGLYNTYKKRRFLLMGIASFLIAHIGFIHYLWDMMDTTPRIIWIMPLLLCMAMFMLCKGMQLHLGKILYIGLIYCYFVSCMAIMAVAVGGRIAMGGSLFFLSDFSILFLYFYHFKEKKQKKIVHYFNLVTYYFAILLFLTSIQGM